MDKYRQYVLLYQTTQFVFIQFNFEWKILWKFLVLLIWWLLSLLSKLESGITIWVSKPVFTERIPPSLFQKSALWCAIYMVKAIYNIFFVFIVKFWAKFPGLFCVWFALRSMVVLIHVVSNPIREKTAGLVKISGTHPNDLESYFALPAFYYSISFKLPQHEILELFLT